MITMLRPGYSPPNRKALAGPLLTETIIIIIIIITITNLLFHWIDCDSESWVVPLHLLSVVADTCDVGGTAAAAVTSRVTYATDSEGDENDDKPDTRHDDSDNHSCQRTSTPSILTLEHWTLSRV